ncbi:MAG: hypothetical protein AAF654_09760 [Myxococcota bacterium]
MKTVRLGTPVVLAAMFFTSLLASNARADVDPQSVAVYLRLMAYDRNLENRVGDRAVIAVVVPNEETRHESARRFFFILSKSKRLKLANKAVTPELVALADSGDLAKALAKSKADYVFLPKELTADELDRAVAACTKARIPSLAMGREAVRRGASLGVEEEPRTRIYVNVGSASRQGADYGQDLLRLATREGD